MTILVDILRDFIVGVLFFTSVFLLAATVSLGWWYGKSRFPTVVDVNLNGDKNASRR